VKCQDPTESRLITILAFVRLDGPVQHWRAIHIAGRPEGAQQVTSIAGLVWADGADFADTRLGSRTQPRTRHSWTKKSQVHQEYGKVQVVLASRYSRNESVSYIRLGGRAPLTIEYMDYTSTHVPFNQTAADHRRPRAQSTSSQHHI
jgi:hypothetical protein